MNIFSTLLLFIISFKSVQRLSSSVTKDRNNRTVINKDTLAPVLYFSTTKLPQYPGGGKGLKDFIDNNFKWPSENISFDGSVVVSFIVETNGRISNTKVVSCKVPAIEREIIRVFSLMTDWIPGTSASGQVRTLMFLPVRVSLKDGGE